ncbi:MAG: PilZ domain-containing protein [Nitrospiraceae bacterium]|nr:PilZ domain-containing protein [Nitrospiraceae bacterium]
MSKRRHQRFVRRLETEFSAEGKNYRAISSDLSCSGLFIRTNHAFTPGTILDIVIHLPDGTSAMLKGRVCRALKTPVVSLKNGMGIELIERDAHYSRFMRTFTGECEEETAPRAKPETPETIREMPKPAQDEFLIVVCGQCNVKNRVNKSRIASGPLCGKCGRPLVLQA